METEVQTPTGTGIGSLVKSIVNDVGDLIKQQFQFAQAEIKTDLRKVGEASRMMAVGVAVAILGVIVLTFMLVHLLHWLTAPAGIDSAGLPLWACYAIVGGLIEGTGVALFFAGRAKFQSFNPLPDKTAQQVKENLEWMTNANSK
jgi:hypothetical protein